MHLPSLPFKFPCLLSLHSLRRPLSFCLSSRCLSHFLLPLISHHRERIRNGQSLSEIPFYCIVRSLLFFSFFFWVMKRSLLFKREKKQNANVNLLISLMGWTIRGTYKQNSKIWLSSLSFFFAFESIFG